VGKQADSIASQHPYNPSTADPKMTPDTAPALTVTQLAGHPPLQVSQTCLVTIFEVLTHNVPFRSMLNFNDNSGRILGSVFKLSQEDVVYLHLPAL
jgi:hypothetical protein